MTPPEQQQLVPTDDGDPNVFNAYQNNQNNNNYSTEDGDENNLIVLDPDHPLLRRFQIALKKQLERIDEKLTLETRDSKYELEVGIPKILFFVGCFC